MKPSKYNHFFPYTETQSIAYNGLSNALALIDAPKMDAYNNFCNQGVALPDDLAADLKKGKFLLDDFVDELDILRHRMLQGRYNTDILSLTIAPTNDCQFDCVYCYEKDAITSKYMSEDVQDKLVELLESRVKFINHFAVTWYGGEPLMAFDVVESLSKRFINICTQNNVNYTAMMVTNGYMLTPELLKRMEGLHIATLQITLDGMQSEHDRMRPLRGGGGTFETIINNLKNGYDLLPFVSLRVNIDKDNLQAGDSIYRFLQDNQMLEKVRPYFGKLMSEAGTHDSSRCLNMCDFSEAIYDFLSLTSSCNQHSPTMYPQLRAAACGADSVSSYVIDAEGFLYKCWCDIGRDDSKVGNIISECTINNTRLLDYMLYDPTMNSTCRDCNVLPICMGGCPYKRLADSDDNCTSYKYILQKCLTDATSFFKEKRDHSCESSACSSTCKIVSK